MMATAYQFFAELSARHGGVDRTDPEAVTAFYTDTLETLPVKTIETVLGELLECEMESDTEEVKPWYPAPVGLPRGRHSTPVPLPMLLRAWGLLGR
jgi:hypothetical protein